MCVVHEDEVQSTEAAFGGRVRAVRLDRQISQKALADEIGLDASAISRLEQGSRAIRLGESALIAKALNVELGYLVYGPDVDPVIELNRALANAGSAIERIRESATNLCAEMLEMIMLLSENPEISSDLIDELTGKPSPHTEEDLLHWVESSVRVWADAAKTGPRRVIAGDERTARLLTRILEAAIDVVTVEE